MEIKEKQRVIEIVVDVLDKEARAISNIKDSVGDAYVDAIELIRSSAGKVVMTGMGKSGLIARKIAATMSSTGTLAVYLHPAEAAHGDLGMVEKDDVVIALGKSGESAELNEVLPVIKKIGAKIIAITANANSTLGRYADLTLDSAVSQEACPYDLAPTSSTTVALAIGDALAIALMKLNNFQPSDFALYHPGGKLGRRLLLKVQDVMIPLAECAVLDPVVATFKDLIMALSQRGHGIVLFSTGDGRLDGILTDGDVRRLLDAHGSKVFDVEIAAAMVRQPTTIEQQAMAVEALKTMEDRKVPLNVLPVMEQDKVVGIVRLHELLHVV